MRITLKSWILLVVYLLTGYAAFAGTVTGVDIPTEQIRVSIPSNGGYPDFTVTATYTDDTANEQVIIDFIVTLSGGATLGAQTGLISQGNYASTIGGMQGVISYAGISNTYVSGSFKAFFDTDDPIYGNPHNIGFHTYYTVSIAIDADPDSLWGAGNWTPGNQTAPPGDTFRWAGVNNSPFPISIDVGGGGGQHTVPPGEAFDIHMPGITADTFGYELSRADTGQILGSGTLTAADLGDGSIPTLENNFGPDGDAYYNEPTLVNGGGGIQVSQDINGHTYIRNTTGETKFVERKVKDANGNYTGDTELVELQPHDTVKMDRSQGEIDNPNGTTEIEVIEQIEGNLVDRRRSTVVISNNDGSYISDTTEDAPASDVTFDQDQLPDDFDTKTSDEKDYVLWQKKEAADKERHDELIDRLDNLENGGGEQLEDNLQRIEDELEEHNEREEQRDQDVQDLLDANPATSAMEAQGQAAGNAWKGSVPDLQYAPPALDTTNTDVWTVNAFGTTFDMNPMNQPYISTLAYWVKTGIAWFIVIHFAIWASGTCSEYIRALPSVNQAKGNPVVGGTGAQATALIAAAIISSVIVAALVGLFAWTTYDFGLGSVASALSAGPYDVPAALNGMMYLLDAFLPVAGFLGAMVARVVWRTVSDGIFLFAAGVIKFIVP